ncbi:ATP-dependent Clp protease proteolytic subunit [Sphingomonas sp. CFBP 8760]|uniref:ATP-dependent Clp protease proteolytic subunit n=1 Tax=Sphingomonas sp. CFBP 8760 TaxID=2775282 RepID=UPI0017862EB3|nr:ATP-dependent Clp protease proteolytic subunit [Sphingomonas sp. CFBP 8760]MBD8546090.1 ATP-dependent Clp protease proteolytic subunit [Sphingomonas sp. CFBP 8760]
MTNQTGKATQYPLLANPHVQLHGPVDEAMYTSFKTQVINAPAEGPLVVSVTTLGGDPEMARAMGDGIRLIREYTGRDTLFLGKVAVYSAGATFMSAFPVDSRFLTRGSRIMIHERQMQSTIQLNGPLNTLEYTLKAKLHEIEDSIRIQNEGFEALVSGSQVSMDELLEKAPSNWYIEADEAKRLGLVLDVI